MVKTLNRAHRFAATLVFDDFAELHAALERANAFDDTGLKILRIPS